MAMERRGANLVGLVVNDQVEVVLSHILDATAHLLHGSYRLRHTLLLLASLRGCEE